MPKIPLYIPEALPGVELAHWFTTLSGSRLFTKHLPPNFFERDIERVADAQHAKAIVLPNNFKSLTLETRKYIGTYATLGEKLDIPVFVFSLGDFTDSVQFDSRVYVFRLSVYRTTMQPHDIVIPTIIEDPMEAFVVRKKEQLPLVSFCGMGALPNTKAWIKYCIKNGLISVRTLFSPKIEARKVGVYWRRAMMRACTRSPLVRTLFIIRKTFSGSRKTIELDPSVARKEYMDSIVNADFVLAPKGDGNYSNRFLETLAHGRLPVLLDTDVVLPLEDTISYEEIVVRIPMAQVSETPSFIHQFYEAMDEAEYSRRQSLAREVYTTYLRSDAFFRYFFTYEVPKLT